jgi:hypothetical protein
MNRMLVLAALALAVAAAEVAAAGGGPSPGVTAGWKGVAAPDGAKRYVALPARTDTVVAEISTSTGTVRRWGVVRGSFGIPLVALDGTTESLLRDGRTLVLASASGASRFLLYDVKRLRIRERIALRGRFSYDAISPSRRLLYLIEHLGQRPDTLRYRVRAYDLRAQRLLGAPVKDKRNAHSEMRGMPYTRATSRDGVWVYTLYGGGEHSFVHALNTEKRQAICIGLPWGGKTRQLWELRMATRGDTLLVRRKSGALAATIDLDRFRVVSAARLR